MKNASPSLTDLLEPLRSCLPEGEYAKLQRVLELAPSFPTTAGADLEHTLRQAAQALPPVAGSIRASPRGVSEAYLGRRRRNAESLVERLCRSNGLSMEFSMPTGAILGRAFVLAKLNFLKALEYTLEECGDEARDGVEILKELVGETVFSRLSEELLSASIVNSQNGMELRQAAARKLIVMWDDRLSLSVEKLPAILLSAWRARGKVRAVFGTLIGVTELFSLIQAECPPSFVEYFEREHVTSDESGAFREFLFGISYEDLQKIEEYMRENDLKVIRPAQVQEIISTPQHPLRLGDPSPEEMYNSYCRRRIRADYRAVARAPGPRKTAEGYIMETLLLEELKREE